MLPGCGPPGRREEIDPLIRFSDREGFELSELELEIQQSSRGPPLFVSKEKLNASELGAETVWTRSAAAN